MSDHLTTNVWVIGAGAIATAHARALSRLGRIPTVIGRNAESAAKFENEMGWAVERGGLPAWLKTGIDPADAAIVAVDALELEPTTTALLRYGVGRILVEKPAGVTPDSIRRLAVTALNTKAQVFVAYNRRFLTSVLEARRLIASDGGVTSFSFEFTELASQVDSLAHPDIVKANWFLANSSHVIDLAFFLGGRPLSMECLVDAGLAWDPTARFVGCGRSETGALFHYGADWSSAGRWGVEVNTSMRRLILRPLESLQMQMAGSFKIEIVQLDDVSDVVCKPGFLRQMKAFLEGEGREALIDIHAHARRTDAEFAAILSGGSYRTRS